MQIKIYKAKAEFNDSQFGNSKDCVLVEFPNCVSSITGKPFKWMPTYDQLKQINKMLERVEIESWILKKKRKLVEVDKK